MVLAAGKLVLNVDAQAGSKSASEYAQPGGVRAGSTRGTAIVAHVFEGRYSLMPLRR